MNTQQQSFSILGLIIWSLASLFFLYEFFLRTFVGTMATQMMSDLDLNAEKFALMSSGYFFAYAMMQIPVGMSVDKFGLKRILVFSSLVCALSAFFLAYSTNFHQALLSRVIMGFASSFAFICLLVISSNWFSRQYFGFFTGASQFIGTMGPLLAAGPVVKLISSTNLTWQNLLFDMGIVGIVLSILILFIVKNKSREGTHLIYLSKEESFFFHLKRLLKNNQAWYIAFYSGMVYTSISLLGAVWGTSYLQACGFTQAVSANIVSLCWLGYAIGCLSFGTISDKMQRRKPVLVLSALFAVILSAWMTFMPIPSVYFYMVVFFLLGVMSAGQTVAFAAISEHVDLATKATALGLNNAAITTFSTFTPLITGYLITVMQPNAQATLVEHDFVLGFTILPLMCFFALLIALFFIKETFCKLQKEPLVLTVTSTETQPAEV